MSDSVVDVGRTPAGERVEAYTLANAHGIEARVLSYGGILWSLRVPDRRGDLADIVLGYEGLEGYLENPRYFGALVGRYANRIGGARFALDGVEHSLAANDGPSHLHGGLRGFDKVVWRVSGFARDGGGLVLRHVSPDGDEGYPGRLEVEVTYTLDARNELRVDFRAVSDRATVVNLTQHSYFNLAGSGSGDVLGHELTIPAEAFTPVDETLVPTGEIAPVAGTPFDFRKPAAIGARIDAPDVQLRRASGYDHNFVLPRDGGGLVAAARLFEPRSGRTLEVRTSEPGLQLYTGNLLDGIPGKAGRIYRRRDGLCLETQHFPDSPHHPHFPSTVLRPGQEYRSTTIFAFGVE
jgi:aldose 1-epimerase